MCRQICCRIISVCFLVNEVTLPAASTPYFVFTLAYARESGNGSGRRNRTFDFQPMKLTSYLCSIPRYKGTTFSPVVRSIQMGRVGSFSVSCHEHTRNVVIGPITINSDSWGRTSDIMVNSHALYRLSYIGPLGGQFLSRTVKLVHFTKNHTKGGLIKPWPREWDSNPRGGYEPPQLISSQRRYVHFGIPRKIWKFSLPFGALRMQNPSKLQY